MGTRPGRPPNSSSPDPIDIRVGSRLRQRRTIVGMTQGGMAEQLGITFQQVQKYEVALNRISASRLQMIATTLGVPVSFFFDEITHVEVTGKSEDQRLLQDFLLSDEGRSLNRAFARIQSLKVRQKIVALAVAAANAMTDETPIEQTSQR